MHERNPTQIAPRLPSFWTMALSLFLLAGVGLVATAKEKAVPSRSKAPAVTPAAVPPFPQPALSGTIPVDVPIHNAQTPEQARPVFDTFSWQSFIAVNWPAVTGQRGVARTPSDPQTFLKAANGTPIVWGTYKESFDLFGQKDQRPTPWESFTNQIPECNEQSQNLKRLVMLTKGDDTILDASKEAFSFPLIDQNGNYVRYEIRYNKAFYNVVRGSDQDPNTWLYLIKNLAAAETRQPAFSMPASPVKGSADPVGALMIKAAWREITSKDDEGRYYIVRALVYDSVSKACVEKKMGLVGLHIAQKLTKFPEWIWSSFEQVDNVKRGPGSSAQTPISFNNGTDKPPTPNGYANRPPRPLPGTSPTATPAKLTPVQVTRLNAIPDTPRGASTRDINAAWQTALKGTVWQNYELVITQWPSDPGTFKFIADRGIYPKDCGAAFPANGATNTAMETYFQSPSDAMGAGGNSCMSCHYVAGQSDFSWGLNRRAH